MQDLHAPTDVGYEEIMNIEGVPQMLNTREEYDPSSKLQQLTGRPTVQSSSVSFLSAWAPQEYKTTEVSQLIQSHICNSIDTFNDVI